ncbi:MAG: stage II sporulation protein M, partial [Pseudomonadota bacterium]
RDGSDASVRSARFRREREGDWQRLEELLAKLGPHGRGELSSRDLLALPHLYRTTLASLSVARSYVLDSNLVQYLDSLALRAHLAMFSSRETILGALWRILARDLPRSVRFLSLPILLATAVLALGIFTGRALVIERPDLFSSLVSADMAQGRTPFAPTSALERTISAHPSTATELQAMALRLIKNNVTVSLLVIGFGLAFGIPTAILLFYNGVIIGALVGVFALRDLEVGMVAWLSIHGTTELLAICLAGGAGFAIARSMLFPKPRQSRLSSAAEMGPHVARVCLAVMLMLLIAGFLEAFARTLIVGSASRFAFGAVMAAIWFVYFVRVGRTQPSGAGGERAR